MAVPGFDPADIILGPSSREGWAYIRRGRTLPARVILLELSSGREEKVRDFMPPDLTGNAGYFGPRLTRDGRFYAYSYASALSDLYLVEGVK